MNYEKRIGARFCSFATILLVALSTASYATDGQENDSPLFQRNLRKSVALMAIVDKVSVTPWGETVSPEAFLGAGQSFQEQVATGVVQAATWPGNPETDSVCNATVSECNATKKACNPTDADCNTTERTCNSTTAACQQTVDDCNDTVASCNATVEDCNQTYADCNATVKACNSTLVTCNSTEMACNATYDKCNPTDAACHSTSARCNPTDKACFPTVDACNQTDKACTSTDKVCAPTECGGDPDQCGNNYQPANSAPILGTTTVVSASEKSTDEPTDDPSPSLPLKDSLFLIVGAFIVVRRLTA